jgi:hypothetical protein
MTKPAIHIYMKIHVLIADSHKPQLEHQLHFFPPAGVQLAFGHWVALDPGDYGFTASRKAYNR